MSSEAESWVLLILFFAISKANKKNNTIMPIANHGAFLSALKHLFLSIIAHLKAINT